MSRCAEVVGISVRTLERWQRVGGGEDGRHGPNTAPSVQLPGIVKVQGAARDCLITL